VELKLSEQDQKVRAQVAQVRVAWDLREACACACSMLVRGWVLLTHRKASIHLPFLTFFVQDSPPEQHGFLGTHGFSRVHLLLWYTLFNDLCFVPFAHAFFRGVFRDFMLMVLSTQEALKTRANKSTDLPHLPGYAAFHMKPADGLTRKQRKECTDRMNRFIFTSDFDRPPECPVRHGPSQIMEQLMRQPDCVMPLLFVEVR